MIYILSISGTFFFSLSLFFSDTLVLSWFYLEIAALCLIPAFFLCGSLYAFSSIFCYLIITGVCSALVIMGISFPSWFYSVSVAFMVKFGLFPFMGWVYQVLTSSNWVIAYVFAAILKSAIFILCFIYSGMYPDTFLFGLCVCCSLTLAFCSFMFWVYSYSWTHCWCHMSISSNSVLLIIPFCSSADVLLWVYAVYFVWSTCSVLFLFVYAKGLIKPGYLCYFLYVFLLLNTPISFGLFYKIIISFAAFTCPLPVLICWIGYTMSEQIFLFSNIGSIVLPKKLPSSYLVV